MNNVFHNREEADFIGTTFPVIWRKELPDLVFHLNDDKDAVTFFGCEIVVNRVRGIDIEYAAMDDPVFEVYERSRYLCTPGNTKLADDHSKESIETCDAICVVYGIPIQSSKFSNTMKKTPVGFATLMKKTGKIGGNPWDFRLQYAKPGVVVNDHLYIDVICSAFSTSGVGALMVDSLADPDLRRAMMRDMRIYYEGLLLKSLPETYTYFMYRCGFLRSNGDGRVFPFSIIISPDGNEKALYDMSDLELLRFPSLWTNIKESTPFSARSAKELLMNLKPLNVFKEDTAANGFLFYKPIGQLAMSGGGKARKKKVTRI
jgi:hypothetical protein